MVVEQTNEFQDGVRTRSWYDWSVRADVEVDSIVFHDDAINFIL